MNEATHSLGAITVLREGLESETAYQEILYDGQCIGFQRFITPAQAVRHRRSFLRSKCSLFFVAITSFLSLFLNGPDPVALGMVAMLFLCGVLWGVLRLWEYEEW